MVHLFLLVKGLQEKDFLDNSISAPTSEWKAVKMGAHFFFDFYDEVNEALSLFASTLVWTNTTCTLEFTFI